MLTSLALTLLLAQSPTVLVSAGSYHFNIDGCPFVPEGMICKQGEANPVNPGISLEQPVGRWYVGGGYYWNSSHRHTWFGVVGRERSLARGVAAGLEVGVASGYLKYPLPMAVGYVRLGPSHGPHLKINVIPSHRTAIAVQVGFRLKETR